MPVPSAIANGTPATLAAATPNITPVALDHARAWHLVIHNTGNTNAINTVRIRGYPVEGGPPGPWETVSGTVAAGATMSVRPPYEDCDASMDVELTSTSGTSAALWLAGV